MTKETLIWLIVGCWIGALVAVLSMRRTIHRQIIPLAIASELTAQANRFVSAALMLGDGGARRQAVACAHMLRERAAGLIGPQGNLSKDGDRASNRIAV